MKKESAEAFVKDGNKIGRGISCEAQDPALAAALRDFRESVHAWSATAYVSARPLPAPARRVVMWRRAGSWACGVLLAAGLVSGGLYEKRQGQELAREAALRQAELQRQAAEARARETEDLLAEVDRDISRQTPAAMDPLAQLMAEDESK